MSASFVTPLTVRFQHCDPAGIVFFPRYFEMINDCVEAFFDEALQTPFETMHRQGAVPTAEIATTFTAPSRHGDMLTLRLWITHVGGASARYELTAEAGAELRLKTTATLVNVNADGRPVPWPDGLRARLTAHKGATS